MPEGDTIRRLANKITQRFVGERVVKTVTRDPRLVGVDFSGSILRATKPRSRRAFTARLMLFFGQMGMLGQIWPIGLACCVINLPFMIWAVTASAASLDPDLELAAASCGAPPLQAFLFVTLPAVTPGVISGSLLMFILALNEFLVSLLLVDARIVTLPVQIYNSIRSIITPDLAAISVVFIACAAAAIFALDRLVGLDIFLKSK